MLTAAFPALQSTMNDEITKATSDHKKRQWREFVERIYHRSDSTKLWRTIKGIDGKSKQTAENEGITFIRRSHTSPKLITNSFNRQFTTSKLNKHSSLRRARQVLKDVKLMSLEDAESPVQSRAVAEHTALALSTSSTRTPRYRTPHSILQ